MFRILNIKGLSNLKCRNNSNEVTRERQKPVRKKWSKYIEYTQKDKLK